MRRFGVVVAAVVGLWMPSHAFAYCEGKSVLFSDNFKDASWSGPSKGIQRQNGKYELALEKKPTDGATGTYVDWPDAFIFADRLTVCTKIKMSSTAKSTSGSGLLFWINTSKSEKGYQNYYIAQIDVDGTAAIQRNYDGVYRTVLAWAPQEAIKKGPDAINELEVRLNGREGIFLINGKEITKFNGQPPSESYVGIYGAAGSLAEGVTQNETVKVEFSEFMVKN
jgi:hypothetical protein